MADAEETEEPPKPPTGKFFYKNGATYDGEWKVLEPEAPPAEEPKKGKAPSPPDPAEEADPPKRVRHGKGIYRDGDYSYDGDWFEDEMHGQGTFTFASRSCYEGEWKHNQYNGNGRFRWPHGSVYEGEWQDGKMHGQGVYIDAAGHRWAGQFFNGSGPGLTCDL